MVGRLSFLSSLTLQIRFLYLFVQVVALVRSMEKAETVLPKDDKLTILQCDLSNEENIRSCKFVYLLECVSISYD